MMSITALGRMTLALLASMPIAADARTVRVMSFNVRYPNPDDGENIWANRRTLAVATIATAKPDVIGTQELFKTQGDDIVRALPGYRWFGRDRRGGHADEHMGIFYRPDRVRLVRRGDFWLSDTPSVVGSMSWGVTLPRMVNWAVFETRGRRSGHPRCRFAFLDTHFAHRDEDDAARTRSAALILARMPTIARRMPVVLAGDLNAKPDSAAYRLFARRMTDSWTAAPIREGSDATFHDFTGTADRRIDYVFARGLIARRAEVRMDHDGARYPSDHFPLVVDLAMGSRCRGTS